MNIDQIVWLVLMVLFVIAEASTAFLVSIWFCAGALAALLVSLVLPGQLLLEGAVFLLVSTLMLLALRPLASKLVGGRRIATNADANIGKRGQVVAEIQPGRFGRVKVEGQEWTAKSEATLPVGCWVQVDAIEGVKLVVSALQENVIGKQEGM